MNVKEMVRSDFKEFIATDFSVPSDLRVALKSNERVPKFLDNLAVQIEKAQMHVAKKGGKLDRVKIKLLVHEMTKQFIHFIKVKANENYMSDATKAVQKQAMEGDELSQKLDVDGNADLTEELGVKIVDAKPGRTPNKILE